MPWFVLSQIKTQKQEIDALLDKADTFSFTNIDSSLLFVNQCVTLAKQPVNQELLFKSLRSKGIILEDNNRLSEAIVAYQEALNIAETYLDEKSKIAIYNDWAIIHKKISQYKITQEYHSKSIQLAEKIGNWEMVETGYHGLGTMYSMLSNFPTAIYNYKKSIEAAERAGNKEGVILSLTNISNVYLKAKNYDLAHQTIEKAYNLAEKLGNSMRSAAVLKVFANIEMELGHYDIALQKYQVAQSIFEQNEKKARTAEVLLLIGDLFFKQKKYTESKVYFEKCKTYLTYFQPYTSAEFYNKYAKLQLKKGRKDSAIISFNTALTFSDTLRFKEIACENHQLLAKIYQEDKKYELAFQHLSEANYLTQLLNKDNSLRDISEAELRFELQKQELEIKSQQKELQQSNFVKWFFGLGFLSLATMLWFAFRQLKAKQKAIQFAQTLLKELHHRVKNNLQNIISITRLQSRNVKDASALAIITDNQSRLEAISALHQQFYQNEDINKVNFDLFLEELFKNILFKNDIYGKEIKQYVEVDNEAVSIDNSLPIALIINELVSNSIKYAFEKTELPQININIKNQRLHYSDNGKCYPEAFEKKDNKSFGVQLISALASQLDAKYRFYNQDGANFEMNF
jgi:two-component system, sensor histidine kinase PdtaS